MTITLSKFCRFPVKGLPAYETPTLPLVAGQGAPFDRRYALAHASSRLDKAKPGWAPKVEFLMLARDEKLAELGAEFDEETHILTILRKGRPISKGALNTSAGRSVLEIFLAGFMPDGPRGHPVIVEAPETGNFADTPDKFISIINLASVADIGRIVQTDLDPLRFRGNIYVKTPTPWIETSWVGKILKIGSVELVVEQVIGRCSATNINPKTGKSDYNIPLALRKGFGHTECGVYAKVRTGGLLSEGQAAEVVDP